MKTKIIFSLFAASALLIGCGSGDSKKNEETVPSTSPETGVEFRKLTIVGNKQPHIPPQCYTKTDTGDGRVHNPCFTCHTTGTKPNYMNDSGLQAAYDFTEYGSTNRWKNLFEDRSEAIAEISDETIVDYVSKDNYFDPDGTITLARRLQADPSAWEYEKSADGEWGGFIPDCYYDFDEEGFDRKPDGSYTGWRAFAYTPFPGTFWPANGSSDDVLIRLAPSFQKDASGAFDLDTYKVNLVIVEAMLRQTDVPFPQPVDEEIYGVDLDKDGTYGTADKVAYDWAPTKGRHMYYVGLAKQELEAGTVHIAGGLYPEGTEFLHSVRYLDVNTTTGQVGLAPRMKELRYGKKYQWMTYGQLVNLNVEEEKEKTEDSDILEIFHGNHEAGVSNRKGWVYQGFIEDADGELRPQNYEETIFCIGCHRNIGATTDFSFAFPRRLGNDAYRNGWYHWSEKGLEGIAEPKDDEGRYEYTRYLENNGAGDEFRENREIMETFLDENGSLIAAEVEKLHNDISHLLLPSPERALKLNKAYKVIVDDQDFIYGRDAIITPPVNVHDKVESGDPTGITQILD